MSGDAKSAKSFFHDSLSDFDEICRLNHPHVLLYRGLLDVRVKRKPFRQVLIFWKHLSLLWFLLRDRDSKRVILVREFSSVPMWLIGFSCRRHLPKLLLMNHHNLQWALHRKWNRKAMCQLQRWGANFLFFEFVPGDALRKAGLTEKGCYSMRHPVKPLRQRTEPADHDIGFFGVWTNTKDKTRWIKHILANNKELRLLIGSPETEKAKQDLPDFSDKITFLDTMGTDSFHQAMQRCRHLFLCYPRDDYEYRASGLLSDAVANQVSVLIPDYPVIRAQMEWPEPVGDVYSPDHHLFSYDPCINMLPDTSFFQKHYQQRSVDSLACELKRILCAVHSRSPSSVDPKEVDSI